MKEFHLFQSQQQRTMNLSTQKPPSLPKVPPPSLSGDCGDPDYEIIEFPPQASNSTPKNLPLANNVKKPPNLSNGTLKCALCGTDAVSLRCNTCNENYCATCDDMNHRHPKRRDHVRHKIGAEANSRVKPPLPPKGENANPPIPPPRRNRRNAQVGCNII